MSEQETGFVHDTEAPAEGAPEPPVPVEASEGASQGEERAVAPDPAAHAAPGPEAPLRLEASTTPLRNTFGSGPLDHGNERLLRKVEDKVRELDLLTHGLTADLSIANAKLGPLLELQAHYAVWHEGVDGRLAGLFGGPDHQPGVLERVEALEKNKMDQREVHRLLKIVKGGFQQDLDRLRQEFVGRPTSGGGWGASEPSPADTGARELGHLRGEVERLRQEFERVEVPRGGLSPMPDQPGRELATLSSQVGKLREEFERLASTFWPMARGGSLQGEGSGLRGEVEALRQKVEGLPDLERILEPLASRDRGEAGEVRTQLGFLREKLERLEPLLDRLARALLDEAEEVPQQAPASAAPPVAALLAEEAIPAVLRALRELPPEQARGLADWTSAVDRLHQRMEEERRFEERAGALVELLRERLLAGRGRDELAEARNRMVFVDLPDLLAQSEDLGRSADAEGRRALEEFRRRVLEVVGLDEITPRRGEPFDASRHSMLQASHEDGPENTVARCLAPGLVLRSTGQLVRKADVSVHL